MTESAREFYTELKTSTSVRDPNFFISFQAKKSFFSDRATLSIEANRVSLLCKTDPFKNGFSCQRLIEIVFKLNGNSISL